MWLDLGRTEEGAALVSLIGRLIGVGKPDNATIATVRQALIFGAYITRSADGVVQDWTLHRLVSDDYRYIAGVVATGAGLITYVETPDGSTATIAQTRGDTDRRWTMIDSNVNALIARDPATEALPPLNRSVGWLMLRDLYLQADRCLAFEVPSAVRGVLHELSGTNAYFYVEYQNRGVERFFDDASLARDLYDRVEAATSNLGTGKPLVLRPGRFYKVAVEAPDADPRLSLGGRASFANSGTAYAWGSIHRTKADVGWLLLRHYAQQVVLPFRDIRDASGIFDLYVSSTTEKTLQVDRVFS